MNFHENYPAGSEDSMVIQHCRVLTLVMFCIYFIFLHKKRGREIWPHLKCLIDTCDFNS